MVGFIVFGTYVCMHELGFGQVVQTCYEWRFSFFFFFGFCHADLELSGFA